MHREEYLVACLSEEAGEVTQICGKIHRFGINDPIMGIDNFVLLSNEVHDLIGAYELVCAELGMSSEQDRSKIEAKKQKVLRYAEHSRKLGRLIDE